MTDADIVELQELLLQGDLENKPGGRVNWLRHCEAMTAKVRALLHRHRTMLVRLDELQTERAVAVAMAALNKPASPAQPLPPPGVMTDAEFKALVEIPFDNAVIAVFEEVRRSRAEAALLRAELAELRALAAGRSGAPDYDGIYCCVISDGDDSFRCEGLYRDGGWDFNTMRRISTDALLVWHRIPGETYTKSKG